ncbi:MAG: AarF/ABC1/UbiB kinase family protein [Acidimicrobiia bacterium]|nr:AarF/ABC1/UbiB kinase family protein [Acidimicrobiia bacterium]
MASHTPARVGAAEDLPSDRSWGSFSDAGPWVLTTKMPSWRQSASARRQRQAAELPSLYQAPRFPPLRRALTVLRVLGTAVMLWAIKERGKPGSRAAISHRLRIAAETLGPTYIKLAQIISAGEGVFPSELVAECRKLRDQVAPVGYHQVVDVIERDFGKPIHELFANFASNSLAAASIAQVHHATLHDGAAVVVKVQRPGIDELVKKDLRVLAWLAPFLVGRIPVAALANPPALVEMFAETIVEELDFHLEGDNMLDVAEIMVKLNQNGFVIPRPHPDLVSTRILVMEELKGFKFDDVAGMKDAGVNTHDVIRTGMIGFLEGAFVHGVFHGDLHGGNLLVLPDGRTGLLDFGITGRLSDEEKQAFMKMMMTATMNDVTGQVEALRDLGALPPETDISKVIKDVGLDGPPIDPTKMTPDEMIAELQRIMKALLGYGARMPKPLMLYVKNLIFIDGAIGTLAPDLDLFGEVTYIATHFFTKHGATFANELGVDQSEWRLDLDGIKAGFGVDPRDMEELSHAELQERRAVINKRLAGQSPLKSPLRKLGR